ncbi:unnamed protein product [Ambrosiozyma monospora]|uniref:Unnamed protein product n=1 Tax=Ambrosiozyma monospora TaxID=43982 RepID=A0ACB5T345_AMBMO|nr:unnamed protein product [Ambrosiozyma monospora]
MNELEVPKNTQIYNLHDHHVDRDKDRRRFSFQSLKRSKSSQTSLQSEETTSSKTLLNHSNFQDENHKLLDKHILRLPQFNRTDEFLKCITNCSRVDLLDTSQPTELPQALSSLFSSISSDDTSAVNDSNDNNIKYDVLLENQRGAKLFGIPLYGSDPILTPFDPPKFETLSGLKVANMYHYPLPGKSWVWCWKSWHILMIKDVDEEGWIYARMRFGSHHWKGVGAQEGAKTREKRGKERKKKREKKTKNK